MSRVVVAPIVSFIAILVKQFFGIEIGEELQNSLIDAVLLVTFVVTGIITAIRTRKKKKE